MQSWTNHAEPVEPSIATTLASRRAVFDSPCGEGIRAVVNNFASCAELSPELRLTAPPLGCGRSLVYQQSLADTEKLRRSVIEHIGRLQLSPLHRDALMETPDHDLCDYDVSHD